MSAKSDVIAAIKAAAKGSEKSRVAIFNEAARALRDLVSDVCDDPVLAVELIESDRVKANDYNPNRVASPELDLLEVSIREDGITMPVVTVEEGKNRIVVDGFHRNLVIRDRLERRYVPCTKIDKGAGDRMAATIRHNRARGKHQVDLMAEIVKELMADGWDDDRIAEHLGMSTEELLRLKQTVGVAKLLAGSEYSKSWGVIE